MDVVKVSPKIFALEYVFTLIDAVALALVAFYTKEFFVKILLYKNGKILLPEMLKIISLLLLVYIVTEVASGIASYCGEIYFELTIQRLTKSIHKRISRFSCIQFENTKSLNLIESARTGAIESRTFVNVVMDIVTLYLAYFVLYGLFLYQLQPYLVLIIPILFLPIVIGQLIKSRFYFDVEETSSPLRRKSNCYSSYLCEPSFAKETRSFGATNLFLNHYKRVTVQLADVLSHAKMKSWRIESIANFLQLVGYCGMLAMIIHSVVMEDITMGAFASIFATVGTIMELGNEVCESRFGELAQAYGKIKKYQEFYSIMQEPEKKEALAGVEEIELKNVSFSYPTITGRKHVLQELNLNLRINETLALVGENGSGKTTLTKVILGLYEPLQGEVKLKTKNGKCYPMKEYKQKDSAVFQQFLRYKLSVLDNVLLQDQEDEGSEVSVEKVEEILSQVGFDMNSDFFPEGIETMLSKDFDGVDLSGGQWQRIAIARGMIHESNFLVLDEPTSAIDPLQEHELYKTFLELAKDKIGVIVTHRLGLARCCAKIAVMQGGKIVEYGTHEELLKQSSYYHQLWQIQAKEYN